MSDGTPPAPQDPAGHHQGATPPGPPPGYGPAGYPPQGAYPPPGAAPTAPASPFGSSATGLSLWLAVASIAAVALAVSLEEDGDNGWGRIGVWAGFAIGAAVLTVASAVSLNLSKETAWKVGAAGAVGLIGFWVLFVLPSISMNVSFLATVGVVAGVAAVWTADGRPEPAGDGSTPETW